MLHGNARSLGLCAEQRNIRNLRVKATQPLFIANIDSPISFCQPRFSATPFSLLVL